VTNVTNLAPDLIKVDTDASVGGSTDNNSFDFGDDPGPTFIVGDSDTTSGSSAPEPSHFVMPQIVGFETSQSSSSAGTVSVPAIQILTSDSQASAASSNSADVPTPGAGSATYVTTSTLTTAVGGATPTSVTNTGLAAGTVTTDANGPVTMDFGTAGSFQLDLTFDTSVTNATGAGVTAGIEAAASAAANFYTSTFTNNETINLTIEYNALSQGTLGQSETPIYQDEFSYAQITAALTTNANSALGSALQKTAVGTLPSTDPMGGNESWTVSQAEAETLGLLPQSTANDGTITINNIYNYFYNQNAPTPAGTNDSDLTSIFEHEMSENMGRTSEAGTTVNAIADSYTEMDLYRYSAAGTRQLADQGPAYFSYDGQNLLMQWNNHSGVAPADGGDLGDWLTTTPYTADSYNDDSQPDVSNPVTATDLQLMQIIGYDVVCFCRGTLILTERGEVPVEELAVGDRAVTLSGIAKPIVWIGTGRQLVTRTNRLARPIVVRRGALADNVPHSDLRLTHGHALYLKGALIPVENLVNHRSIAWDDRAQVVEYYHVELANHDVLIANGAPSESYYDAHNRAFFQTVRPGSEPGIEKPTFAPVLSGGAEVERVWAQLFERSGGHIERDTTDDPDLHVIVDGERRSASARTRSSCSFALEGPPAGKLQLGSRSGVPSLLGVTAHDHRRLGVAIERIVVRQSGTTTRLDPDSAFLVEGGAYPAENGFCWTDGELALSPRLFAHLTGPFVLTVDLQRPGMRYPVAASLVAAA
jgi:hypothetical protein